jgi:hypothetical protein
MNVHVQVLVQGPCAINPMVDSLLGLGELRLVKGMQIPVIRGARTRKDL